MASEDNTVVMTRRGELKESSLFGVSMRGWIAYLLVFTVCANQLLTTFAAVYLSIAKQELTNLGSATSITEPLYTIVIAAMTYYFAKMNMPKMGDTTTTTTMSNK